MENQTQLLNKSLGVGGWVVLAAAVALSSLSRAFVFGVGYAQRPILPMVGLLGLMGLGMGWAFCRIDPHSAPDGRRIRIGWIIAVSLLARLFLFPSGLIQETDPYRYLWDGNAVLHGVNPYLHSPMNVDSISPTSQSVKRWQVSVQAEESQEVHRRINHAGIRTVYPPLAQGLFALAQWMTPWSILGWRVLVLLADLANLALILGILFRSGLPLEWALLYGWSPLILKEFGNSLHADVFVVLGLTLMVLALQSRKIRWAFLALALAGLVKLAPLLLMIPLVGWALKRSRKHAIQGLAMAGGLVAVAYAPFLSAGPMLWDGLSQFAGRWRVNEGLYGGLAWGISRFGLGIPWTEGLSRAAAAVVLILVALWITRWIRQAPEDLRRLWAGMLGILTAFFLLLPMANPWYFTWTFPFLVLVPVRALVWFSVALGMYYLDFYSIYRGAPGAFAWVRLAEYGSTALVAGWELWRWRKQSQSLSRSLMSGPLSVVPSRT